MNVLIADLDKTFISDIQRSWSLNDTELFTCSDQESLMPLVKNDNIDLAFIEVPFLTLENMDMVSYLKERNPGIEIFVLCDSKNWPGATGAINRGANSFLMKPISLEQLESTAQKIQSQQQTKNTHQLMESQVLDSLLGDTPEMRKILKTVYKIAPTTSTVLITGESGSGKEFLANVVHRYSKRAAEPFVAVNCGAIPENLVESELFGAKKGSYTGSTTDKKGLFEAANGGTLFLDEVGELSASTQVKLLRFLQNHEIRRVGETEARYLDVRIIAATNRERERKAVIPTLIRYFILKYKEAHGKDIVDLEPAAQYALTRYAYPGNIRELENIVEHAIVLSENGVIRLEDLPEDVQAEAREKQFAIPHMTENATAAQAIEDQTGAAEMAVPAANAVVKPAASVAFTPAEQGEDIISLEEMERRHILHALSVCKGNQTEICEKLGISRSTLWRKMKALKIQMEGESA